MSLRRDNRSTTRQYTWESHIFSHLIGFDTAVLFTVTTCKTVSCYRNKNDKNLLQLYCKTTKLWLQFCVRCVFFYKCHFVFVPRRPSTCFVLLKAETRLLCPKTTHTNWKLRTNHNSIAIEKYRLNSKQ